VTDEVLRFLDDFRAAEAAAAEVLAAWIGVCPLDGLRGGLCTIAGRERTHADLLAERLWELGAPCAAALGEEVRVAALARFGSAAVPDEEKLALVLARYPDEAAAVRPIAAVLPRLADDPETHALLQLIAAGESASVAWLRAYRAGLTRRPGPDREARPAGVRRGL
jgi:hypothetical protein